MLKLDKNISVSEMKAQSLKDFYFKIRTKHSVDTRTDPGVGDI